MRPGEARARERGECQSGKCAGGRVANQRQPSAGGRSNARASVRPSAARGRREGHTHGEQEADCAAVNLDVREQVRVALEQAQRREEAVLEVLEEEGLAVERVD